jgi:5S rRNA maturation endonuclease (ribonuclease M5)
MANNYLMNPIISDKIIVKAVITDFDETGKEIYSKLMSEEITWSLVCEKYFIDMKNYNDVEYNNRIIRSINKNVTENQMTFTEFFGLIF